MTPDRTRRVGRIIAVVGCLLAVVWLAEAALTRTPLNGYHVVLAITAVLALVLLAVQKGRGQP